MSAGRSSSLAGSCRRASRSQSAMTDAPFPRMKSHSFIHGPPRPEGRMSKLDAGQNATIKSTQLRRLARRTSLVIAPLRSQSESRPRRRGVLWDSGRGVVVVDELYAQGELAGFRVLVVDD